MNIDKAMCEAVGIIIGETERDLTAQIVALEKRVAQIGAPQEFLDRVERLKVEATGALDRETSNAELLLLGFARGVETPFRIVWASAESRLFGSESC